MSQNDFNQPESSRKSRSSVPQPPAPKQPFFKALGIKALRSTIRGLENVVETLESRPRRPNRRSRRLRNFALTGILAGIAVLAFWFTSNMGFSKPTEVAIRPSPPVEEPTPSPSPIAEVSPPAEPEPPASQAEPIPAELSSPESSDVPISPQVAPTPAEEPAPQPSVEPEPLVIETPKPVPPEPPKVELTPEQSLIASIQSGVVEISDRYSSALVQSVQPNFRRSRLVVQVSDGWYGLASEQQDQLANDVLTRSQDFDFIQLELKDNRGSLVARSPVVGTSMVILKRVSDLQKVV